VKGNDPSPKVLQFKSIDLGNGVIEFQLLEPIFLSNWPVYKGVPNQSVDISVHATFYYKKKDLLHTRSNVYLTYFLLNRQEMIAEPFANLRFDYHPDADDDAHPLLHAHIFSNDTPPVLPPSLKDYNIKWDTIRTHFGGLRVPIPNMTLPSVLLCLVACHLGADKARDLLNKSRDNRKQFPHLNLSHGQIKLLTDHSIAGCQWFERA